MARGGEAIVYKVVQDDKKDEIVAKCTIFDNETSKADIKQRYKINIIDILLVTILFSMKLKP